MLYDDTVVRAAPSSAAEPVIRLARGHKVMEYQRRGAWVNVGVFDTLGLEGWVAGPRLAARRPGAAARGSDESARGPEPETEPRPAPASPPEPEDSARFILEVTGSPALSFTGSCSLVDGSGALSKRSIDGLIPKRFEIAAAAVSCTVQKMDSFGRLQVRLRNGRAVIAERGTAGPFNYVQVRSSGPWGRARALRGGTPLVLIDRQAPRRIVPPLAPPSVPSLAPPSIPSLAPPTVPPLRPGAAGRLSVQ